MDLDPGDPDDQQSDVALASTGVSVSFGNVHALRDVSLTFRRGALHVLVGQNGAGKSTFARVCAGLIVPDAGRVQVAGTDIANGDVGGARRAGLEMVHQNFTLPPSMTVSEALELFSTHRHRRPFYRRRDLDVRWQEDLERTGVNVDPRTRIRDLPIETLQAVEITRALAARATVLLLDEPTAVLSPAAVDRLFATLRKLRDDGVTVITVLHKLREVEALADMVSVLRDGRLVLEPTPFHATSHRELSGLIVGDRRHSVAVTPAVAVSELPGAEQRSLLRLLNVASATTAAEPALDDVSLTVGSGEILGVAGVEGNGQRALVGVITGLQQVDGGSVEMLDDDITRSPPSRRRAAGIRIIPFDRNSQGISQSSSLWQNVSVLGVLVNRWGRRRLLQVARLRHDAAEALDRWQVRYSDLDQRAGSLSGGNVQRLILARELSAGLTLLIAAQPTRGLDVAATEFVRATLGDLRRNGSGVLLVSSDLDELFELSDRLVVMLGGRIVAEFRAPFDIAEVGAAMVGAVAPADRPDSDDVASAVQVGPR